MDWVGPLLLAKTGKIKITILHIYLSYDFKNFFSSNLVWMPNLGMPTCWKKFRSLHEYPKNTMCSTKCVQVGHKSPFESMFFWHRQMTPNFFHELI